MSFWDEIFWGNTLQEYAIAAAIFIGAIIAFKGIQTILLNRLALLARRTKTDIDDTIIGIVQSIRPPFYAFLALWIALQFLKLNALARQGINAVLIVWVIAQVVVAAQIFITYLVRRGAERESLQAKQTANLLGLIAKIVLWAFGILFLLQNLGIEVTSLIAGLGIGGLAVALAAQNILEDLFSSFSIHFDKPFRVGDFIVIGDKMGTVERIGIKTTRVRSLQGEELIFSNKALTVAEVQNFGRMRERRVVFTIGVEYGTPTAKMREIPEVLKKIIDDEPGVRFDRAHFKKFNDSSMDFEVVYYVEAADYAAYMDRNEEILYKTKDALEEMQVAFAFPTQTIHVEK